MIKILMIYNLWSSGLGCIQQNLLHNPFDRLKIFNKTLDHDMFLK